MRSVPGQASSRGLGDRSCVSTPHEPAGLADALGVELDSELLTRALTHRSYAYEHGGLPHNERLEFLGDSVLGVVITETLYRRHPDLAEGKLAKLRASVVNMRALADIGRTIGPEGLGAFLRLGRGEEVTGGRDKASILADTVEAVLGAVYLEHGLHGAERVIHELFDPLLDQVANNGAGLDWKTGLQELTAERGLGVPEYEISSVGPDHAKIFTARASVNGELFNACTGRNKKEAEQAAAEAAWRALTARDSGAAPAAG
ncbi:MAG: ribonuclease III [Actinobacteria bacterium]|nr:ribonuclease III [Actinomycetota bacterium]